MSVLNETTPLVLTYNEEANLDRTLACLHWAPRVVVVDSHSTDATVDICGRYANVEVLQRSFDDHTAQWNFGLDQVKSPWVLSLDADYVLSDPLLEELGALVPSDQVSAYFAEFTYCVFGQPLRGSLYPPRAVLFRRDRAHYVEDGHTQRLEVRGPTARLTAHVLHDDRKPLDRWWTDQMRYAVREARHLTEMPRSALSRIDRVRRDTPFAPVLILLYTLFCRGLILDGWRGAYYSASRTLAELLLFLLMVDRRLRLVSSNSH